MAYSHFLIPHAEPELLLANLRRFAGMRARLDDAGDGLINEAG